MKKLIFLALLSVSLCFADSSCRHICPDATHETCDGECECDGLGCHETQSNSTFHTDAEEGSDAYYIDLNHFRHPEWTYEQCERAVFE